MWRGVLFGLVLLSVVTEAKKAFYKSHNLPTVVSGLLRLQRLMELEKSDKTMDLEVRLPTNDLPLGERMKNQVFNVLLAHASNFSNSRELEEKPVLTFSTLSNVNVWHRFPPLTVIGDAVQEFEDFAGNPRLEELEPRHLMEAYRTILNIPLTEDDARKMILNIMINDKPTISVDRCEYALAVQLRRVLDPSEIKDALKYYNPLVTIPSVQLAMGLGVRDYVRDEIINRVFMDAMRTDLGRQRAYRRGFTLTKCEYLQLIAWTRDSMFRSFFETSVHESAKTPETELEVFEGLDVYDRSDLNIIQEESRYHRQLARLMATCDANSDGSLSRSEFRTFLHAIEDWQVYSPKLPQLNKKPVAALQSDRMVKADIGEDLQKVYEEVWDHVAGPKAMSMTQKQLANYLRQLQRRRDRVSFALAQTQGRPMEMPLVGPGNDISMEIVEKFRNKFMLPAYNDPLNPSGKKLLKVEFFQALFGNRQLVPSVDVIEWEKTFGLLSFTSEVSQADWRSKKCDRDCWSILSPIIDVFHLIDEDASATISESEIEQLTTVVPRLANYESLKTKEERHALFEFLLQSKYAQQINGQTGVYRRISLAALASAFSSEGLQRRITLKTFLDPPQLKVSRTKTVEKDRSTAPVVASTGIK